MIPRRKIVPLVLLCVLALALFSVARTRLGHWAVAQSASDSLEKTVAPRNSQVQAVIARVGADGMTEKDFTAAFLGTLRTQYTTQLREQNEKSPKGPVLTESEIKDAVDPSFVMAGNHKLALIRFRANGASSRILVIGIDGDQSVRVMCSIDADVDVSFTSGSCDEKMKEAFGASIDPKSETYA